MSDDDQRFLIYEDAPEGRFIVLGQGNLTKVQAERALEEFQQLYPQKKYVVVPYPSGRLREAMDQYGLRNSRLGM